MKKLFFTLVCMMLTMSLTSQAKPDGDKKDKKEKFEKRGDMHKKFSPEKYYKHMEEYISKSADLTDNEKAKFFPLFKEMLEAQRKIVEQDREVMRSFKDAKTESDFEKIIDKTTSLQVENKKIEQTYYKKFAKVLTWEKICKVRMAQTRFNMKALRSFSPRDARRGGRNFNHRGFRPDFKDKKNQKNENAEQKQS